MGAFTLIELLIVIAIMGIIASVIVTSFGDQRENAREEKAKFNVAQIARNVNIKLVEKKITGSDITDNSLCPRGTKTTLGNTIGTLYCSNNANSDGVWIVYEKYRTNDDKDTYCMDQTKGAPIKIDLDSSTKSETSRANGGCGTG